MGSKAEKIEINCILAKDIDAVVALTEEGTAYSDTRRILTNLMMTRTADMNANLCYMAVCGDELIGYIVVDVTSSRSVATIVLCVVKESHRREKIGSLLLRWVVDKVTRRRGVTLRVLVRESQLAGQLFLKHHGYMATSVLRDHYPDTSESAYVFTRDLQRL